jgi:hypothetical protein
MEMEIKHERKERRRAVEEARTIGRHPNDHR